MFTRADEHRLNELLSLSAEQLSDTERHQLADLQQRYSMFVTEGLKRLDTLYVADKAAQLDRRHHWWVLYIAASVVLTVVSFLLYQWQGASLSGASTMAFYHCLTGTAATTSAMMWWVTRSYTVTPFRQYWILSVMVLTILHVGYYAAGVMSRFAAEWRSVTHAAEGLLICCDVLVGVGAFRLYTDGSRRMAIFSA
jgi:hypothetical protein